MTDVLERCAYDVRRRELRRIVIATVIAGVMSATWYSVRPAVIDWAARSSLGCRGREAILGAALQRSGVASPDATDFAAHTLPEPGWVLWGEPVVATLGSGAPMTPPPRGGRSVLADHELKARGSVVLSQGIDAPPSDADGDGKWEVVSSYWLVPLEEWDSDPTRIIDGWFVVRLGSSRNEVVWVGMLDPNLMGTRSSLVKPIWRDEDGDGVQELVFVTFAIARLPSGRAGFRPPKTVAVFAWDAPGGVLRPVHLPPGGGVLSWPPPGSNALSVDRDAYLPPVLRKLLPVPDSFGRVPTSRPATQPSAAPVPQ